MHLFAALKEPHKNHTHPPRSSPVSSLRFGLRGEIERRVGERERNGREKVSVADSPFPPLFESRLEAPGIRCEGRFISLSPQEISRERKDTLHIRYEADDDKLVTIRLPRFFFFFLSFLFIL